MALRFEDASIAGIVNRCTPSRRSHSPSCRGGRAVDACVCDGTRLADASSSDTLAGRCGPICDHELQREPFASRPCRVDKQDRAQSLRTLPPEARCNDAGERAVTPGILRSTWSVQRCCCRRDTRPRVRPDGVCGQGLVGGAAATASWDDRLAENLRPRTDTSHRALLRRPKVACHARPRRMGVTFRGTNVGRVNGLPVSVSVKPPPFARMA